MWSTTRQYTRPILFLLYINFIKNSSLILNFFLFADDTSTLLINKDTKEIEKTYNIRLENVKNWLDSNKLSVNVDKSSLVLFQKNKKKITTKLNIKMMGEQLKEKEFTKYLGILTDNKLTWSHHIFFSIWVFFHDHSRITGLQGKGGDFFNSSLPLPPASQTLRH